MGWSYNFEEELKEFHRVRRELSVTSGCILRIIAPKLLRPALLEEVHQGHPGIVYMKELARASIYGGHNWTMTSTETLKNFILVKIHAPTHQ